MKRCAAVAGAVLASLLAPISPYGASAHADNTAITWGPCPDEGAGRPPEGVECGEVEVPVDWDHPRGPTIALPVARRGATRPSARIGALMVNPGGPTESGTSWVIGDDHKRFTPELRSRFDLIGVDTRDALVQCDENLLIQRDELPMLPVDQAGFDYRAQLNQQVAESCRSASPDSLADHVDSATIAQDLDAVRHAIGEPRLNFYGVSYGTLIGQMYAEQFPTRLRTLVLDSVVDHSGTPEDYIRGSARAEEDAFLAFARWCERDDACSTLRARAGGDSIPAYYDQLYRAAEHGRLRLGGDPVSRDSLLSSVHGLLQDGDLTRRDTAEFLAQLEIVPTTGRLAAHSPDTRGRRNRAAAAVEENMLGGAVPETRSTALICGDWNFGVATLRDLRRAWGISNRAAPHTRANAWNWEWITRCTGWPGQPGNARNPQHDFHAPGAPPLLLVNMAHDVATPHAWASRVADQSPPGSRLLTYRGSGHAVYKHSILPNTCGASIIDQYFIEGPNGLPESDTYCVPEPGGH
ncbi:alpha/beta hydrolase [Nocardiopsis rhodophaea]|uniref:alpha/beta hydrolase n=1 Tax=Nocardiopsis rhodophaea TaxID=280238 RepID=UPI0031E48982